MDQTITGGPRNMPPNPEIVREFWREIARLDPGAAAPAPPSHAVALADPGGPVVVPLSAMLAMDDDAFIHAAYAAALGRAPDPTGTGSIQTALAAGVSKSRVLASLRSSPEGQAAQRVIPGLALRTLLDRVSGMRLVGRPVRRACAAARRAGWSQAIAAWAERPRAGERALATMSARLHTLERSQLLADAVQHGQGLERARIDQLAQAMERLSERLDAVTRRLVALDQSVTGPLASVVKAMAVSSASPAPQADGGIGLDALYVAFEDHFRGPRATIRERQRVYLPDLIAAGAGTLQRPVLDVGSGRGELLELLRDEGLSARGVDMNTAMVEQCGALGLDVTLGDAVAVLSSLPPDSLGAVTGFHIIEHLSYPSFVRLLDESLRALAPGGIVVFETPNPANLLVASRYFYLDPTHRNPLPGEMVAAIATARGFTSAEIRPLHPMERRFTAQDPALAAELDALFHGPMDYALIARKP